MARGQRPRRTPAMDDTQGLNEVQRHRNAVNDSRRRYYAFHRAALIESAFVFKSRQFVDDNGQELDGFLLQPRSEYALRRIRFKAGQLLLNQPYIEPLPQDEGTDPEDAEIAKSLLEAEVHDNYNGYMEGWILSILAGLASRRAVMTVDWDARIRERSYRNVSMTRIHWQAGVGGMHSRQNRVVYEERRVPLWFIKEMSEAEDPDVRWDPEVARKITATADYRQQLLPASTGGQGNAATPEMGESEEGMATLIYAWQRDINEVAERVKPGSARKIPKGEQYLYCTNRECGYQSETEDEAGPLPDRSKRDVMGNGGCPICGSLLLKAKSTVEYEYVDAFAGNKKLTIFADEGPDEELWEGDWPYPSARTFPYFCWDPYPNPEDECGPSETSLMWTNVVAQNICLRIVLETVYDSRDIMVFPKNGLEDENQLPFRYNDERNPIAYYTGTTFQEKPVHRIDGSEVRPSLLNAYNTFVSDLRQNEGSSDIGMLNDPNRSKDIAVGTVDRMLQTGDIPLEFLRLSLNVANAKWLCVVLDIIKDTSDEWQLARMFPDLGRAEIRRFKTASLPRFDIRLSDAPATALVKKERAELFKDMLREIPPQFWAAYAAFNSFPPSVLRMMREAQAQTPMAPPGGGGGTAPGAPPGPSSGAMPLGPGVAGSAPADAAASLDDASPDEIDALIESALAGGP